MSRFALLEHTTRDGVHWDFLFQLADVERLPTWRLTRNPLLASGRPIAAERIADHRALYLDFEGEISGDRGTVRRVDGGGVTVARFDPTAGELHLRGLRLIGRAEWTTDGPLTLWTLPPPIGQA